MTTGNDAWRNAIGMTESGNNYSALGPVVKKGRYAGERALGRFQIMPGNLPQWSQQALGRQVTPEEFLARPEIQDAIFDYQFGKSVAQYGTFQDAASVWHSGRPLSVAAAAGATDGYLNTVSYVKKATGFLEGGQFSTPHATSAAGGAGPMSMPGGQPLPTDVFSSIRSPLWNSGLDMLTQAAADQVGQLGTGGFGDLFGTARTINQTTAGTAQVLQSGQTQAPVAPAPMIQFNF